ncbi:MAG TPA: sortase, partial [Firmicutes bacterium]|nr:sortase [Bacillota bacterium]
DQENGNVILAGHSGSARISYFKKLDNLSLGDMVYIDYNSKLYSYKVVDIYDIDKTGKAEIIRDKNKSTLT